MFKRIGLLSMYARNIFSGIPSENGFEEENELEGFDYSLIKRVINEDRRHLEVVFLVKGDTHYVYIELIDNGSIGRTYIDLDAHSIKEAVNSIKQHGIHYFITTERFPNLFNI